VSTDEAKFHTLEFLLANIRSFYGGIEPPESGGAFKNVKVNTKRYGFIKIW
jgi:hypothetical protein